MDGMVKKARNEALTPAGIAAKMQLTPQQRQQLDRIVLAGQKVMFAPETRKLVMGGLSGPAPMTQKLGQSLAGLLGLLVRESSNSLPGQLLIPAGMVLMAHAVEALRMAGINITDEDMAEATGVMVQTVLGAVGIDADRMAAVAEQYKAKSGKPAAEKESA